MAYDFPIPNGYIPPEGLQEGQHFEDIATFQLKKDGKVCLTKMGDSSVEKEDGKDEDEGDGESRMMSKITEAYRQP